VKPEELRALLAEAARLMPTNTKARAEWLMRAAVALHTPKGTQ
jgi:hypothetical protein